MSFLAPHFPLVVPEPYFSMYYPHNVDLPLIPPGHIEGQHPAHERGRLAYDLYDYTEEQIRRCRAAYYGLVTHLDERIGRLLDALQEGGLREDTVVVYTSDHGEFIGEHGLWWKNDFYEHSSRVPLLVSWPGRFAAGARFEGAVSLLDLTRTLVDLAGAPDPGDLDGDSLLPVLRDPRARPGRTRPSASTTGTPPTGPSACCAAVAGSCATTTARRRSCTTCGPTPAS